jgi:predicted nucleotidyltransferase
MHAIDISETDLRRFCLRWRIARLELFGSALRGELKPESDVDFLVTWEEEANWGLFEKAAMERELAGILGRPVDLVSRRAIEASPNHLRREGILARTETIYAA